jgi:hypothetical protein
MFDLLLYCSVYLCRYLCREVCTLQRALFLLDSPFLRLASVSLANFKWPGALRQPAVMCDVRPGPTCLFRVTARQWIQANRPKGFPKKIWSTRRAARGQNSEWTQRQVTAFGDDRLRAEQLSASDQAPAAGRCVGPSKASVISWITAFGTAFGPR